MLKLKVLGSGSSGNCYLLSTDNETLILDAGLPIKEIKKGLRFDLSKVAGILVTHSHLDHSLAVKDLERMGFGMTLNTPYYGRETVFLRKGSQFQVKSFPLTDKDGRFMHTNADGSECPCYGFLITHPELGRMLYITDTELVKWRFKDINHILISCNYQKKYVDDENAAKRNHVLRGHMELETVKEFIKANKSNTLETVILCHLSRENANPKEMLTEVKKVANCEVYIAEKGIEIELKNGNECPF